MYHYDFDYSVIRTLRNKLGLSQADMAKRCGIPVATYLSYEKGKSSPGVEGLVGLANGFDVPADFLLRRTSVADRKLFIDTYNDIEQLRKRIAYEDFLQTKPRESFKEPHPSWPYNLVQDVLGEKCTELLNEDREAGIMEAVDMLGDERMTSFILLYYREDKTLDEIGNEYDLSRERVRQIIARGRRCLMRGRCAELIQYGKEGSEVHGWETTLKQKKEYLEKMEKMLDEQEKACNERLQELMEQDEYKMITVRNTDLLVLDLSVRSINILRNAGAKTVHDVMVLYENGMLSRMRNIGAKSIEEIGEQLKAYLAKLGVSTPLEQVEPAEFARAIDPDFTRIEVLDLSVRSYNALRRAGINTVQEAIDVYLSGELMNIRNLGTKSAVEVQERLMPFIHKNPNDKSA